MELLLHQTGEANVTHAHTGSTSQVAFLRSYSQRPTGASTQASKNKSHQWGRWAGFVTGPEWERMDPDSTLCVRAGCYPGLAGPNLGNKITSWWMLLFLLMNMKHWIVIGGSPGEWHVAVFKIFNALISPTFNISSGDIFFRFVFIVSILRHCLWLTDSAFHGSPMCDSYVWH